KYEKDTESTRLAIESESVMTDSIMANNFDFDIELKLFLFNYTSFNKAREFAEVGKREDISILRENNADTDLDSSNIVSSSASNLEFSIMINDENEFLVNGIFDANTKLSPQLSACSILNFINGNVKCCENYSRSQRPLTQLIRT
ncbi:32799_t:CDS:1, partial [Racocetra persica]